MIIAVCVDEKNGMSFFEKRQSRDKEQIKDLMKLCDGKIRISTYSSILFEDFDVIIDDDLLVNAVEGDYCFIENKSIEPFEDKVEKIIIYKWNRHYPSDKKFVVPDGFLMVESFDFKGNSHEKITREIFVKEEKDYGYEAEENNMLEYCFFNDIP